MKYGGNDVGGKVGRQKKKEKKKKTPHHDRR